MNELEKKVIWKMFGFIVDGLSLQGSKNGWLIDQWKLSCCAFRAQHAKEWLGEDSKEIGYDYLMEKAERQKEQWIFEGEISSPKSKRDCKRENSQRKTKA